MLERDFIKVFLLYLILDLGWSNISKELKKYWIWVGPIYHDNPSSGHVGHVFFFLIKYYLNKVVLNTLT